MDDLALWLALSSVPAMDIPRFQRLLEHLPLAEFFSASPAQLQQYGLTARQSEMLLAPNHPRIEAAMGWLSAAPDRHFIRCIDPRYPELLKQIKQPPLALFVIGEPALLQRPQLAIVGSRQPTPSARQTAFEFAAALSQHGLGICSGLAQGIDGAAHQGALSVQGNTVAVLGHGLCHLYPKQHAALTAQIAAEGALVSEYLPDQAPRPEFFPLRNRIVVGLSLGTLVVEAALKSGSLISAGYAAEYSREVFAIPGSIYNPQAAGCHQLIQQGAKLTTCPADILDELADFPAMDLSPQPKRKNNYQQDLFETGLLANVGDEATAIDVIAARAQLPVAEVSIALLQLELTGEVAVVPGGYIRVRRA
jgi:DNA processing protein